MFYAKATLENCFTTDATEKYPESFKIQLLGDVHTKNGQKKRELITLNVTRDIYNSLTGRVGENITVPIGAFSEKNSSVVHFFFPKGTPLPQGGGKK